jgi:hypothetical protein
MNSARITNKSHLTCSYCHEFVNNNAPVCRQNVQIYSSSCRAQITKTDTIRCSTASINVRRWTEKQIKNRQKGHLAEIRLRYGLDYEATHLQHTRHDSRRRWSLGGLCTWSSISRGSASFSKSRPVSLSCTLFVIITALELRTSLSAPSPSSPMAISFPISRSSLKQKMKTCRLGGLQGHEGEQDL